MGMKSIFSNDTVKGFSSVKHPKKQLSGHMKAQVKNVL